MRITGILGVLLFSALIGGVFMIVNGIKDRDEEERRLKERIARIASDSRAARIVVDTRDVSAADGRPRLQLRWSPIGKDGRPLKGAEVRNIEVIGDVVYFDTYQIVFEGDAIQEDDPLRGKTLTLFARVFGEHTAPADGAPLEVPEALAGGSRGGAADFVPPAFRQSPGEAGEFERALWARFWDLCRDPEYAKSERVRTAQGTAVSKVLIPGREYTISVSPLGTILIDGPLPQDPLTTKE